MHKEIMTVRNFDAVRNIDNIIERWAVKAGFKEGLPNNGYVNMNNITYCFYLDEDHASVFLTIKILDDRVRLETWAMERVEDKPKHAISELLVRLRQAPLQPGE